MIEVIGNISDVAKEKLAEAVQVYCLLIRKTERRAAVLEMYDKARFRDEVAGILTGKGRDVQTFNEPTSEDAISGGMERADGETLVVRAETSWSCIDCGTDVFPQALRCEKCDRKNEKRKGLSVACPRVI